MAVLADTRTFEIEPMLPLEPLGCCGGRVAHFTESPMLDMQLLEELLLPSLEHERNR